MKKLDNSLVMIRQQELHKLLRRNKLGYTLQELADTLDERVTRTGDSEERCTPDTVRKDINRLEQMGARIRRTPQGHKTYFAYEDLNQPWPGWDQEEADSDDLSQIADYFAQHEDDALCRETLKFLRRLADPESEPQVPVQNGELNEYDAEQMPLFLSSAIELKKVHVCVVKDDDSEWEYDLVVTQISQEKEDWTLTGRTDQGEVKFALSEVDSVCEC